MEIVSIIASIIAAVAAVATLCFSIRSSKGNILKRIDKKEQQIRDIDNALVQIFGLNDTGRMRALTSLDYQRDKLKKEVAELKRKL